MAELLTEDEHTAIRLAGELYTHIVGKVIGHGRTRRADITEVSTAVHHIQHAVMAQAAARAYPGKYRLFGELPGEPAPAAGQACQVPGAHGEPVYVRTIEQRPCDTCPAAPAGGEEQDHAQ